MRFAPIALLCALCACSSDVDDHGASGAASGSTSSGGGGAFSYDATVDAAPPPDAETLVVWSVSATSPDYVYNFGDATVGPGQKYVATFSSDPPPEALNNDSIGIGYVLLLAPGTPVPPSGKIMDWNAIESALVGATAKHAIIFKKGAIAGFGWAEAFPEGYACGACVSASSGFDSYEPVDCADVELEVPPDPNMLDFCNWT